MAVTEPWRELCCHAGSAPATALTLSARIAASSERLLIEYLVRGDVERLIVPATQRAQRRDDLWRHTCCECFIALDAARYLEFNFAPSSEWAAYQFERYRQGMRELALPDAPRVQTRSEPRSLLLTAQVPASSLPAGALSPVRVSLCAVLEERGGHLSYWALRHPAPQADFHHPDGFVALNP